jgi:hypothetical protein
MLFCVPQWAAAARDQPANIDSVRLPEKTFFVSRKVGNRISSFRRQCSAFIEHWSGRRTKASPRLAISGRTIIPSVRLREP